MNSRFNKFIWICAALLVISCDENGSKEVSAKSDRSVQYFPNMYESAGYETYQEADIFPGNVEAQKPVDGTVSRGWMPYEFEDTNEGYASAKASLTNPVPLTEDHLNNGQALYGVYCAICHGDKGNGVGHLVETEKILGVPSYDARELTEGSIYHVMYYGINYMGSYASQTSIEERWEIAHYVEALRSDLMGTPRKELVEEDDVMDAENDRDEAAEASDKDSEVSDAYPAQPNEIENMNAAESSNAAVQTQGEN